MTLHEQYAKEAMNEAQKLEKKIHDHEKYADALDTIHSHLMERAKLYANRRRFKDARRILEEARDVKTRSMEQRDSHFISKGSGGCEASSSGVFRGCNGGTY